MESSSPLPPPLHPATLAARRVIDHPTNNFLELIKIAELNPSNGDLRLSNWAGIDFSGLDLRGFDFSGANLTGCRFNSARIEGARFDFAQLQGTQLTSAEDWPRYVTTWTPTGQEVTTRHLPYGAVFTDTPLTPTMTVGRVVRSSNENLRVGMSDYITNRNYLSVVSWHSGRATTALRAEFRKVIAEQHAELDKPHVFTGDEVENYFRMLQMHTHLSYMTPQISTGLFDLLYNCDALSDGRLSSEEWGHISFSKGRRKFVIARRNTYSLTLTDVSFSEADTVRELRARFGVLARVVRVLDS